MAKNYLTEEQKAKLKIETKGMAGAFLEDLALMREMLSKETPSRAELRSLSNLLRRLIVNRDIEEVASPRLGQQRLQLRMPDNRAAHEAAQKLPVRFYASARVQFMGIEFGPTIDPSLDLGDFHPDDSVEVSVDRFQEDNVLCYDGRWVTRRALIKYVAIVGHGVHSKPDRNDEDEAISAARGAVHYKFVDGMPAVLLNLRADPYSEELRYDPDAIDPVLIELLAAARCVVDSPMINRLEETVREELGL